MMFKVLCEKIKISIPKKKELLKLVESECYKALCEIKKIIDNKDLSDEDCFYQIEQIVCLFEKIGSACDGRHDF